MFLKIVRKCTASKWYIKLNVQQVVGCVPDNAGRVLRTSLGDLVDSAPVFKPNSVRSCGILVAPSVCVY